GKSVKYYVGDVEVSVAAERVQYFDPTTGQLITESLKDYTRKRIGQEFASLDEFVQRWTEADQKQAVIDALEEQGVLFEALAEEVGKDFGPFDLICHVAYDQPPLTRRERADNVRKRDYFAKYGDQARAILNALLDKYADEGIENLEDPAVLRVDPLVHLGTPIEIVRMFGGKEDYLRAIRDLEKQIYATAK
ncbi:MAG: type I restriction-modification enzyme R subunit C-terminal domain-containing protein, partial [Planctomycetaceae bacterium]